MFFAAILAGLAAGLAMSALQHFRVTPYILAAEIVENQSHAHPAAPEGSKAESWSPAAGLERTAYTALANIVVSVAFALVLAGASLILRLPITSANGALWGLCGFIAFSLAPSAGLPPELPGMAGGELVGRQMWWWFAVAATAGGLALIAKRSSAAHVLGAAALIASPHLIGAPLPSSHAIALPAHLASAYVANALATAAVFWVVLGLALGFMNRRASKEPLAHDAA